MTPLVVCARCETPFTPDGYHSEKQERLKLCPACLSAYEATVKLLTGARPLDRDACGKPLRAYSIMPPAEISEGFPRLRVYSIMPPAEPAVCMTCADRDRCEYKKTRVGALARRCVTWRKS